MVTGESQPVDKYPGDPVTGATVNHSGLLRVRADRVGSDTLMAQIVKMVRDAQADKAPIQRFADRVSAVFVPVVIAASFMTFLVWYLVLHQDFIFSFKLAIAVMVIACPCAMGLATPTAIMVGSGIGLARGILIKRASVLENIAGIEVLLLDKTGTITTGTPELTDLIPASGVTEDKLLEYLIAAESRSSHPLAQAALRKGAERGVTPGDVTEYSERGGYGVLCSYGGRPLRAGNARLVADAGIQLGPFDGEITRLANEGKSLIFVVYDGVLAGVSAFTDPPREGSRPAIDELKRLGITTRMVTGDRREAAASVAAQAGVDGFDAELLPGAKLEIVKKLQEEGRRVGMAGDGINDAPALAAADIGIAIGSGTDVAKETGDVVLVRNDLMDVVRAIRLGRATLVTIRQNLFWALFYNVLGIPVAAGALYFPFGITLKPEFAGLAMALSSVSVVANSLLLKRIAGSL
jgi:Cu+-exporting ATPase